MVDELDAGPILAQEHLSLSESDYIGDVYARLDECIPRLFADVIDGLAADTLRAQPQSLDPADALRCHPRRAEDGHIRWTASAVEIARLVRASAEPFAGAQAAFEAERLIVWRRACIATTHVAWVYPARSLASTAPSARCMSYVVTAFLELQELELGGVRAPAAQFLSSTRDRLTSPDVGDLMALRRRVAEMEAHLARVVSNGR
jgi:methionyl-tRNA formyltransferase